MNHTSNCMINYISLGKQIVSLLTMYICIITAHAVYKYNLATSQIKGSVWYLQYEVTWANTVCYVSCMHAELVCVCLHSTVI